MTFNNKKKKDKNTLSSVIHFFFIVTCGKTLAPGNQISKYISDSTP